MLSSLHFFLTPTPLFPYPPSGRGGGGIFFFFSLVSPPLPQSPIGVGVILRNRGPLA